MVLSVHDQVANLFSHPYPESVAADFRRAARKQAFSVWREIFKSRGDCLISPRKKSLPFGPAFAQLDGANSEMPVHGGPPFRPAMTGRNGYMPRTGGVQWPSKLLCSICKTLFGEVLRLFVVADGSSPAGGEGDTVFPPTFGGAAMRWISGMCWDGRSRRSACFSRRPSAGPTVFSYQ
jgi:hypothetical protein